MLWNAIERLADWADAHPRTANAIILGTLSLAFVGACYHIRYNEAGNEYRYRVLHGPRPDPYVVCPRCAERFDIGESHDYDELAIEMYFERGRNHSFEGPGD